METTEQARITMFSKYRISDIENTPPLFELYDYIQRHRERELPKTGRINELVKRYLV